MKTRTVQHPTGAVEIVRVANSSGSDGHFGDSALQHEQSIVWVEDISRLPFVRSQMANCPNRSGALQSNDARKIVGYARLNPEAPPNADGKTFARRIFFLTEADRKTPHDGQMTMPASAVDPATVLPTVEGTRGVQRPTNHAPQQEAPRKSQAQVDTVMAHAEQPKLPGVFGRLVPTGGGDEIPLLGKELRVGRREENEIVLRFSNVSSTHCRLDLTEGYWFITDLNSTNGVKVNSKRIPPAVKRRVDPGVMITIGKKDYVMIYDPKDNGASGAPPADEDGRMEFPTQSLFQKIGLMKR